MANVADGTRARVAQRNAERADPADGDAEENEEPEVVLRNGVNGDNPLDIPERGEEEAGEEYAFRVMRAISQCQIESFNQMVQSMRDISKEVKRKRN